MPKKFHLLNQSAVQILIADGQEITVPMLPPEKLGEISEISAELGRVNTHADIAKAKQRIVTLVAPLIPPEYAPNLARFRLDDLIELLLYLAYGDIPASGASTANDSAAMAQ